LKQIAVISLFAGAAKYTAQLYSENKCLHQPWIV